MNEIIGVLVAIILVLVGCWIGVDLKQSEAGYRQCIAELPRDQDCKLIAVPEVSDE